MNQILIKQMLSCNSQNSDCNNNKRDESVITQFGHYVKISLKAWLYGLVCKRDWVGWKS